MTNYRYILFSIIGFCFISLFLHSADIAFPTPTEAQKQETGSPILPPISANWVATDGAGRTLPTHETTGNFRRNKYVGIFYFLWHGQWNFYKDKTIYDITALTKSNPVNPKFGPKGVFHWWGEPEIGYFKSDDPWVIRRNLQLLTLAGIDVLFFDATNAEPYLSVVNKLCEISRSMRNQGIPTPYICFVTFSNCAQTVTSIYQQFYAQNRYSDLWFHWQGKPLILGKKEEVTNPTIQDFFTWGYCCQFTDAKANPNHWQWMDSTPQDYGWTTNPDIPEQIPVAVATHPVFGQGKSYSNGRQAALSRSYTTKISNQGLHFAEQWKRALAVDPSIVFVTGWNEWAAQRFVADTADHNMIFKDFINHKMRHGETFFMDLYNQEFNRDIDPMKGGYTDNYYYQLIANVRRFKGMPAPEKASSSRTIKIDGQFDEWHTVTPKFIDPRGDVLHRNWPRVDNKTNYVNKTGRNDIIESLVTYDVDNIYFYAKTDHKLTSSSGKNWMLLFVDADQSTRTGWVGYDFMINQTRKATTSTISKWTKKGWVPVATASFRYTNNELEISVPRSAILQTKNQVKLDFHWADNIQQLSTITEFFLNGDNAPDRRFNYRFVSK